MSALDQNLANLIASSLAALSYDAAHRIPVCKTTPSPELGYYTASELVTTVAAAVAATIATFTAKVNNLPEHYRQGVVQLLPSAENPQRIDFDTPFPDGTETPNVIAVVKYAYDTPEEILMLQAIVISEDLDGFDVLLNPAPPEGSSKYRLAYFAVPNTGEELASSTASVLSAALIDTISMQVLSVSAEDQTFGFYSPRYNVVVRRIEISCQPAVGADAYADGGSIEFCIVDQDDVEVAKASAATATITIPNEDYQDGVIAAVNFTTSDPVVLQAGYMYQIKVKTITNPGGTALDLPVDMVSLNLQVSPQ